MQNTAKPSTDGSSTEVELPEVADPNTGLIIEGVVTGVRSQTRLRIRFELGVKFPVSFQSSGMRRSKQKNDFFKISEAAMLQSKNLRLTRKAQRSFTASQVLWWFIRCLAFYTISCRFPHFFLLKIAHSDHETSIAYEDSLCSIQPLDGIRCN